MCIKLRSNLKGQAVWYVRDFGNFDYGNKCVKRLFTMLRLPFPHIDIINVSHQTSTNFHKYILPLALTYVSF